MSAVGAGAQPVPSPTPTSPAPAERLPADDAGFVRLFNAANTNELEQAKYVVNLTKNAEVRAFAQHMIDDHSTAAVRLQAATRGTNLRPVPRDANPNAPGSRMLSALQAQTGTDLDALYMRLQVPQHRRALDLLQWEAQRGQAATLTALAANLVPTVQQHLQIAQNYLAAHNLTPYAPPMVLPVPGNPNPNGIGSNPGAGTPNNPASTSNGGSSPGGNVPAGVTTAPRPAPRPT